MATKITNDNITSVDAAKLSGTIADARFPATLPAISGANLTNIDAGGAWSVKSSGTFSTTTSLDITSVSKTTRIIVDNIILSSDAGYTTTMRFSTDNGSSWITSSTYDTFQSFNESVLTDNRMYLGVGSWGGATNEGFSGQITIHGPNNTTANTIATWNLLGPNTSGTIKNAVGGARLQGSNNVNAIQFFAYATSIASGSYTVLELN
jgi:hypothetical protein